jgi:hypothetical protein
MLKPYLLQLDLQLFSADGGEFGGYDPSSAYDGIVPASEPKVQPQGQGEGFQRKENHKANRKVNRNNPRY